MNSVIVEKNGTYVEKRSRFLSYVFNCLSKEDEEKLLKNLRKDHASARHICYASSVDGNISYNDDREPAGTAGAQLALILSKYSLVNTLLVVVRYFGGVKLGTSGLANAYKTSAEMCVADNTREVFLKEKFSVKCAYPSFDQLKKLLTSNGIEIFDQNFGDEVTFNVYLSQGEVSFMPQSCVLSSLGEKKYM